MNASLTDKLSAKSSISHNAKSVKYHSFSLCLCEGRIILIMLMWGPSSEELFLLLALNNINVFINHLLSPLYRSCFQTQTLPLFYRALLEKYLRSKVTIDEKEPKVVGRLATKCSSFVEYVQRAVKKLELDFEVGTCGTTRYLWDHVLKRKERYCS